MRVDAPLVSLALAANVAAHNSTNSNYPFHNNTASNSWSASGSRPVYVGTGTGFTTANSVSASSISSSSSSSPATTTWSASNGKQIADLEKELEAVKAQLAAAGASCTATYSPAFGSGGDSTSYVTLKSTILSTVVKVVTDSHSSASASSPAALTTAWSSAADNCTTDGNFYALQPPVTSDVHVTKTKTVTIIVRPGQTLTTTTAAANPNVDTCTETYLGTGAVPHAPAATLEPDTWTSVSLTYGTCKPSTASWGAPVHPSSSRASVPYPWASSSSAYATGSGFATIVASPVSSGTTPAASGSAPVASGTAPIGTAISSSSSTSSAAPTATADCSALCSTMTTYNGWDVTPETCTQLKAGVTYNTPIGQSSVSCGTSFTPKIDVCQITLNVKTSGSATTYMEVWLPNGKTTPWNGRTMNTDNGGLNGCVHYVDMQYVSGMGFATIGDNAGHNGSSFDGTWTMNNNEAIIDWSYRARHASVDVGKQVVDKFYSQPAEYSYYIGCSAGGAQGLQSAQKYPNDFDGIISGASANDFNHLQDWSAHFLELTGTTSNDSFLSLEQWTLVQSYILKQCDEPLDGVADGILEDPTLCKFDSSAIPVCSASVTSGCLNATQIHTVNEVFKPLYNTAGTLIYPALLYGAQVDAFKLGLLAGKPQGIAQDFFRGGVYNSSSFDITKISQADFARADALDDLHGNPSAFNADLSAFRDAGSKLMMYHGMADPMTSGTNSQRYYQKVAKTLAATPADLDKFLRFYRIAGMAHCGVGGISGAGPWMFGQTGASSAAPNNIVANLVDWVENNKAPDTLRGTKFWYDTPSLGIEFQRDHCRYPYRTTYLGGDSTLPASWGCKFIEDWQVCEGSTCSGDGSFA